MTPPPGLQTSPDLVCHFSVLSMVSSRHPMLGLSASISLLRLSVSLRAFMTPSCSLTYVSSRGWTVFLLYLDDMILTGDDPAHIAFVKQKLYETFLIMDLGQLRYFPGIEVTSHPDGFRLSQHCYTLDLLARSGITDTQTVATPMKLHLKLWASDGTPLPDPLAIII